MLGLPLVNLVYRHLAATGQLEGVWRELRPNLTDPAMETFAAELLTAAELPVAPLSRATLAAAGVSDGELAGAVATLDAYNHANPRNLVAIRALLEPARRTGRKVLPGGHARPLVLQAPLLPMADLEAVDAPVLALLEEMAQPFAGRGEQVLIPGLFRHFASNPALLALLWTALRPQVEGRGLARCANVIGRRAGELAAALPSPVQPVAEPETRAALTRFAFTLPRMIVVGGALRRALR